jgi:RNA polymerase sigma-70 factor (ECF subfamily)
MAKYLLMGHPRQRFNDLEHSRFSQSCFRTLLLGERVEVIDMYATTSAAANANAFCIWPRQGRSKQQDCDESDLVARLQAHDETALREIIERYSAKICRVCYGILHNRDDADEIAQEVFAKVYFSIKGFEGRSSVYAWIYRIALNECYGFLRKKRFKLVYSSDSPDDTSALRMDAIADRCPTPDRTALQRDLINKLLARIPEADRWLLIAKEVEGFSLAELSQMTGLNENAIKVRLFRIRQGLVAAAARLRSRLHPTPCVAVEVAPKM